MRRKRVEGYAAGAFSLASFCQTFVLSLSHITPVNTKAKKPRPHRVGAT